MRRSFCLFALSLALLMPTLANACCNETIATGYVGLHPGYYGNTYYGGGPIYYPNSPFFYSIGSANPYPIDCRAIPGRCHSGCSRSNYSKCNKVYTYRHCSLVRGHRDKHGCWIARHRICY